MELENGSSPQEDSIHASLMNILPDDGLNYGQSEEESVGEPAPQPASQPEAKAEEQAPEAKQDAPASEEAEFEYEKNGVKYKVPAELKDDLLRQSDYTKKTMELAEKRKALETEEPPALKEAKEKLSKYELLLGQAVAQDQQTDWIKLLENDPVEYLRQKEIADARAREWEKVSAQRNEENATKMRQTLTHEWEQLIAKQPAWKDEAVWKADREKLNGFLQESGYKPEEINSAADHRALILANKARLYDELMKAKTEAVKKIEKLPPKVERAGVPSANDSQGNMSAMQALRQSGSVDDAAAAIRGLMG